jgi:hypothetical protein
VRGGPASACQSAPAADAYAAVLSLDHPGRQTPANDPVRPALLDVNNDHHSDEHDLMGLAANVFPSTPPSTQDWSRDDLNGDGFTGGPTTAPFELDTTDSTRGDAPILGPVTQTIDGSPVSFDENAATDMTQPRASTRSTPTAAA